MAARWLCYRPSNGAQSDFGRAPCHRTTLTTLASTPSFSRLLRNELLRDDSDRERPLQDEGFVTLRVAGLDV